MWECGEPRLNFHHILISCILSWIADKMQGKGVWMHRECEETI
jgi:hypothetical protein